MSKLALALIVKGSDDEAIVLNRCLSYIKKDVDGLFITITHEKGKPRNEEVEKVCQKYEATISDFEWVQDFASARNFNFSQVPKEYTHILWCDADDAIKGAERLRKIIEDHPDADGFGMWYIYHFDEQKMADVSHKKTMIIKNDGCASWLGALHEDLCENRKMTIVMIDSYAKGGVERLHLTNDERTQQSKERNVKVAQADLKKNPNDPSRYFNVAQSYVGIGEYLKAKKYYKEFLERSSSEEERYIVQLRLGLIARIEGKRDEAIQILERAIGMKPEYPDAYHELAYTYQAFGNLDNAERYILIGLHIKPKTNNILVYNPRDYDYNPMKRLVEIYEAKNRPDLALPFMEACYSIYPKNKELKEKIDALQGATKELLEVVKVVEDLKTVTDKAELLKKLDAIPEKYQSHPMVAVIRNTNFIKTESSGKDLVYYCYPTAFEWHPGLLETKGFGGSEEAVMNLAKQWAKLGWNVTVYNNCGAFPLEFEGVKYKPFWMWNYRDVVDVLVLWRHPQPAQYELGAKRVYLDLHDVLPNAELTENRLKNITKIFVKTHAHRALYSEIPDHKFAIIPNGMDFGLFDGSVVKNKYLMVNTSSPDRSMDVLPKLFKEVKKQVPEARLKWAYGFDIFNSTFARDKVKLEWRDKILAEMEEAGIENLGRLSQKDCAKLYQEANILAYPTEFFEIDCITVKKAQACGAIPVTTDFGALEESVQFGVKVHSKKNASNWSKPHQFSFGLEDEKAQKEWVDACVKLLKAPKWDRKGMEEWSHKFEWPLIAEEWNKIML